MKTYGFAIAIIIGAGGLVVGGVGMAGYLGAISNLNQVHAITMMAAGGGGGAILFIIGVVGNCKAGSKVQTRSSRGIGSSTISSIRQPKFIERTAEGTIRDGKRFGKAEWETYFGEVGEEPPLPDNIDEILDGQCPFSGDPEVKVRHTHMLVLVPKTVNGENLTLETLQVLLQNPDNDGHKAACDSYNDLVKREHGKTPVDRSHWVLMTRDVIPGSRKMTYEGQKELVRQYAGQGYVVPNVLDAAVCFLMEHVTSGVKLFGKEPLTYTRCAEKVGGRYPVVVGGFDASGFDLHKYGFDYGSDFGVAALRKL